MACAEAGDEVCLRPVMPAACAGDLCEDLVCVYGTNQDATTGEPGEGVCSKDILCDSPDVCAVVTKLCSQLCPVLRHPGPAGACVGSPQSYGSEVECHGGLVCWQAPLSTRWGSMREPTCVILYWLA